MVKRVLRELKDDKGKVKQWQEENVSETHHRAHENDPKAPYSTHIQDESDAAREAGVPDAELQSNKSRSQSQQSHPQTTTTTNTSQMRTGLLKKDEDEDEEDTISKLSKTNSSASASSKKSK